MIPPARPLPERVAEVLARGPVVQNATQDSVTIMGRPVELYLQEKVTIAVTPRNGSTIRASGMYERSKDTFEITVTGLPHGTACGYTLSVGDQEVGPFHFITAPASDRQAVRIAFYGDTRTQPEKHESVANAILSERPCIVLHSGDLVTDGRKEEQWNPEYFLPARNLFAYVPVYPCLGNHEHRAKYFFDLHSLPGNESYYAFGYGCVRFIIVDLYGPYGPGSEQYKWLEAELAKPRRSWTIVMFHEPPFGAHPSRGINWKVVENLVPLLGRYKVDVVVSGDDHHYVRSKPLGESDGAFGVTYLVSGGGGAPLYDVEQMPWTAVTYKGHHYIICDASPDELRFVVRDPEGKLIDTFVMKRNSPPVAIGYLDLIAESILEKERAKEAEPATTD